MKSFKEYIKQLAEDKLITKEDEGAAAPMGDVSAPSGDAPTSDDITKMKQQNMFSFYNYIVEKTQSSLMAAMNRQNIVVEAIAYWENQLKTMNESRILSEGMHWPEDYVNKAYNRIKASKLG